MATAAVSSLSATAHGGSVSEIEEDADLFKRLDVASDHSDHIFSPQEKHFRPSSALQKTISKEWRKLEENLPDSIFVRIYENRVDLMRAAIVGAAGTPYHDGLFVFDIKFPSNYPQQPPAVRYRSYGARINPNLYNNGYICLSLLNTWTGRKRSERWDPQNSNMLQVLLSIQALVLNERPYYNEPWLIPTRGHQKKSKEYTEKVFLLSCKTMICLMNMPPKGLEALVRVYFRRKAAVVLEACAAYASGRVQVGYYCAGCAREPPGTYIVPDSFKTSVKDLYLALLLWFQRIGAEIGHLPAVLRVEQEAVIKKTPVTEKKAKKGFFSKIIAVLKKIECLKDTTQKNVTRRVNSR